ncbi:outer membrane beta-barrel protein [Vibrio sp. VB16]|uniref:outer membrane beta-barrel protein n=1 Tax=Vibrio sp. VB16 TaxID=2785746 RepID=UPI00189CE294|nr:outer membrane beta-barrel protein [Vibrio sp. VB16]UGA56644.1 outer membrane beta-barrel protein [Vibrio sp. VB16]
MKKITLCLLGASIAFNVAADESGFYIGGKTGWTHFSGSCEPLSLDCDKEAMGGGLFLGYSINDWLAIESGYDYLGKAKATYPSSSESSINASNSTKVQGVELGLKADYYLADRLNIFGKVGGFRWQAEQKMQEPNRSNRNTDDGTSLMLGTGLEYQLSDQLRTRLEYQWFDDISGSDVSFLTVGLAYTFGSTDKATPVTEPEVTIVEPEAIEPEVIEPEVVSINELSSYALFKFDGTTLSSEADGHLSPMLKRLQDHSEAQLFIIGHTDSQGSASYNEQISLQRAQSVASYFENNGIAANRIQVEGRGESEPVADNSTLEGRALNRRTEVISPSFSQSAP